MPNATSVTMDSEHLYDRREIWRRAAMVAAVLCVVVAAVGLSTWIVVLHIRPPCPPNYVRLVDLAVVMPEVCGGVLVVSLGLAAVAWSNRVPRFVLAAAVVLGLFGGLLFVGGAATVASYRHQTEDPNCWTF